MMNDVIPPPEAAASISRTDCQPGKFSEKGGVGEGTFVPIFTVSILFDVSEHIWKVCRAHTVIEKHATRNDAIYGACAIAVSLRRHMYCDMSFRLRDRYGGWHTYTFVDDDRPASAIASSLLSKYRHFDVMDFVCSLSGWRTCIRPFLEWNMRLLLRRSVKPHFSS